MAIPYTPGEALTCEQIRELDVLAIEHVGIPGIVLMENAGRSVAEFVFQTLIDPARARVLVFCGPGNNGGDGFVVARHLRNAGIDVDAVLAGSRERMQGDAGVNLRIFERLGGRVQLVDRAPPDTVVHAAQRAEVIVDALLGTGSRGEPRDAIAELIRLANAAPRARRIAVDIPSGLDGNTGKVHDPCVQADATVTFVAAKIGFEQHAAAAVLGRVIVADIGIPRSLIPGHPFH